MDRRTTLKSIFALSVVGISSFSVFKWTSLYKDVNTAEFLSYKSLIAELAETIIPATDTPGAKEAGVDDYIINVLTNCTEKRDQNRFLNELKNLKEYANDTFNKSFEQCNANQRNAVLEHFEEKEVYYFNIFNKVNNKFFGRTFFLHLKQLTVEGYCQSEIGATQGLRYDYIPINYEPCIPLKFNEKSWATK